MGFIRLLIVLAIGYFIWLNIKTFMRKQEMKGVNRERSGPIPIVRCDQCQLHLPETEAINDGSHWFCNTEHRQKWLARKKG